MLLKDTLTSHRNQIVSIAIIAGLFFIFGFVTWINGALIPFMKTIHELTDAQSYLVASASYISFVVMALPSAYVLKRTGYRKGMKYSQEKYPIDSYLCSWNKNECTNRHDQKPDGQQLPQAAIGFYCRAMRLFSIMPCTGINVEVKRWSSPCF